MHTTSSCVDGVPTTANNHGLHNMVYCVSSILVNGSDRRKVECDCLTNGKQWPATSTCPCHVLPYAMDSFGAQQGCSAVVWRSSACSLCKQPVLEP